MTFRAPLILFPHLSIVILSLIHSSLASKQAINQSFSDPFILASFIFKHYIYIFSLFCFFHLFVGLYCLLGWTLPWEEALFIRPQTSKGFSLWASGIIFGQVKNFQYWSKTHFPLIIYVLIEILMIIAANRKPKMQYSTLIGSTLMVSLQFLKRKKQRRLQVRTLQMYSFFFSNCYWLHLSLWKSC